MFTVPSLMSLIFNIHLACGHVHRANAHIERLVDAISTAVNGDVRIFSGIVVIGD